MKKGGAIYIMANNNNTVLYVGVTQDLIVRIFQHKSRTDVKSFTYKYSLDKLVYFETFHSTEEAICRDKQLKAGNRVRKERLINLLNPEWKDLYEEIENW